MKSLKFYCLGEHRIYLLIWRYNGDKYQFDFTIVFLKYVVAVWEGKVIGIEMQGVVAQL